MSSLQELLNLGLVDIGPDDTRFEKIQSASSDLSSKFKDDPSILVPATLVALDETVDEKDPLFDLVEDIVAGQWKTLRNTHINRPRELLRSVIIDAIADSVTSDPQTAAAVWHTAASPLRHRQTRLGKAATVIESILKGASEYAEREAIIRAELVPSAPKRRGKKTQATKGKIKLDITSILSEDDVFDNIAQSAGPNHPQSQSLENPNPQWPNTGQPWAHEFVTRMAAALMKAVNLGVARLGKEFADYLDGFEKQLSGEVLKVEELQKDILQTHHSSRMRLDVLWWSQALYSPLIQVGYRDLKPEIAAITAAIDLANIVPALSPTSVVYVLDESIRRVNESTSNNEQSIQAFLDNITGTGADFGEYIPAVSTSERRGQLIDLVGEANSGTKVTPEAIRQYTGVNPELALSPGEFSMWIFRCIQANRLVGLT